MAAAGDEWSKQKVSLNSFTYIAWIDATNLMRLKFKGAHLSRRHVYFLIVDQKQINLMSNRFLTPLSIAEIDFVLDPFVVVSVHRDVPSSFMT